MSTFAYILIFTFIGSILSLVGGIILLLREKFAIKISHYLSAFAAGALLGVAFLDLLPEGLKNAEELGLEVSIFLWALTGVLTFFLLERFIHWFHHHHEHTEKHIKETTVPLVIVGDGVHNFIDGVVIAATFMVSVPLGIVTAIAVAAHEIPQEIGDFGILLNRGLKKGQVLFWNIISALTAFIGAILTYLIGEQIEWVMPNLLALTAGFFIYIAASDLIPEIHHEEKRDTALWETLLLF